MHECSRPGKLAYLVTTLCMAAAVFGCVTPKSPAPTGPSVQAGNEKGKTAGPEQVQPPVYQGTLMVTHYPPPRRIDFCGEPVPLERQDVLEGFDREFTLVVYNHAQVYQWLKRKERYFARVAESLRRLNLPEDLKYVAIAESEPPLSAPVARRSADMRYDFGRSPESAFQYLGELYRNLKSWPLAIAAYKCGEKRIVAECRAQGATDCYQLMLPQDAERYVYRVLAIKAVLSDPTRYGYELPKGSGYP